ncbi:hypothetical protein J699_03791 [Acinetobacter sp. 1000160]|nr:hypothetical protein J699_03791 [Acinetobacter sp. 1000160]
MFFFYTPICVLFKQIPYNYINLKQKYFIHISALLFTSCSLSEH